MPSYSFYEFFAGGGMARLGLGDAWECTFANDIDAKKGATYRANFNNSTALRIDDINRINASTLPSRATLAWASFPCQDFSLAGQGLGLRGERSGVFWPFWNLMMDLKREHRNAPLIVLENVEGLITSHNGDDLRNILTGIVQAGYTVGAMVIDASLFLPQSRPRLFLVGYTHKASLPSHLFTKIPNPELHPKSLQKFVNSLLETIRKRWVWWHLPRPDREPVHLADIIESEPEGVSWHAQHETEKYLSFMTPIHRQKVAQAQLSGNVIVGTIYKRTREDETGKHVQRAEVRFDGISGCLRTPGGGSSRQTIIVVEGDSIRTRLISPREIARLMGIPETYILPSRYNETYHLIGDGLAVPVVSWLETHLLRPLADSIAVKERNVKVHIMARMNNANSERKTVYSANGNIISESNWTAIKRAT